MRIGGNDLTAARYRQLQHNHYNHRRPFEQTKELLKLLTEASAFIGTYYQELAPISSATERLSRIQAEIKESGTYWQSLEELVYGAKLAWRNSTRCVGRLHWDSLIVHDMRHLSTAEDVFASLVEHIRYATNEGKIRPLITIFAPQAPGQPGIRIWNSQLIRYAGYQQADDGVIGDPLQAEFTDVLLRLGWPGGKRTRFDILPLVIQMPHQAPRLFTLPEEAILEVPITHPRYAWFAALGLKWHALPVISNMRLEIGGISYTAAPFNGWYMGAEIGVRNLGDQGRYNLLPTIASKMGLNTRSDRTLWRDQALIELNIAVLHSFACKGVTMVDHHTVCRQFMLHREQEWLANRCVYADWGWIVPPLSASLTPVFHQAFEDKILTPNFFYQSPPWLENDWQEASAAGYHYAPSHLLGASLSPVRKTLTLPSRHRSFSLEQL